MLLIILSAVWMLLLPFAYGNWLLGRLRRWGQPYVATEGTVSLLVIWWLGLALLTAIVETWALVGPLQWPVFLAVAVLAVACIKLEQASWRVIIQRVRLQIGQQGPLSWVVGGLVGLLLLILSTLPPINGDTAIYHAPAVSWLERVGAVPGLANLDVHLGYNPSWFSLEVLSSWGQWLGSPLQSLDTLTLLLFAGYALVGGRQQPPGPALYRLLLGIVMLFWYGDGMLSLAADPAAAVLSFLILSQVVELGVPGPNRPLTIGHLAIMVLVCYAITIKFSVVPLALVPLVWWLLAPQPLLTKIRLLGRLASICLALVLPWMLNTVVLTGYLLFPFPALDVLPVAWKFPRSVLYEHITYIRNFARNPALSQYNVYGKPLRYWLPVWWKQQQAYDQLVTLATPSLALLGAVAVVRLRAWRSAQATSWGLVLAITLAGTGFWFISAPAYRFGYPFTLPLVCLLVLPPLVAVTRIVNLRRWLALGMVGAVLGATALVELRSFGVPRHLTAAEFERMCAHIPAGANRDLVVSCYEPASGRQYNLRLFMPTSTKLKLVVNLLLGGSLQGDGLMATSHRWLRPAPYPLNTFEPFRVGNLTFMRPAASAGPNEYGLWYAPFPAVFSSAVRLRTGTLAGGFLPWQGPIVSKTKDGN